MGNGIGNLQAFIRIHTTLNDNRNELGGPFAITDNRLRQLCTYSRNGFTEHFVVTVCSRNGRQVTSPGGNQDTGIIG